MINIVKIGGNVVDSPDALAQFIADFAAMPGQKILVHGGGKEATRLAGRLGVDTQMIEGRRVTSREMLDVAIMVYAGLVNKRIVAMLQAAGCNAMGLSGADAGVIRARRRAPEPVDYGHVGDIAEVDGSLIATLLRSGIVPVFCAITHDGNGSLLNCNADSVASAVAVAASKTAPSRLIYCFEMPGVMADISNPDSLIKDIRPLDYAMLRASGIISKGMIPKIDNAFASIDAGVESVVIKHASALNSPSGTTIRR